MSRIKIELFSNDIMELNPKKPIEFRANNMVICYIELDSESEFCFVSGKLLNEELENRLPEIIRASVGECYKLIVDSVVKINNQTITLTNSFRLKKYLADVDYKFIIPST